MPIFPIFRQLRWLRGNKRVDFRGVLLTLVTMRSIFSAVLASCLLVLSRADAVEGADWGFYREGNEIVLSIPGLKDDFKVMFIADAHLSSMEGLVGEYADYASRMGKSAKPDFARLKNTLDLAEKEGYAAVVLGGDIINFPSKRNVELLLECVRSVSIPVLYTSGNHDWHFEGEAGSDMEQRRRWVEKALLPLYADGKNWALYSRVVNGVKLIIVDNSTYEILPEQLGALEREISDGHKCVIFAHIPFYFPATDVFFGCGNPNWKAENDLYFKVERRQRWPERGQSKTTFDFWERLFSAPNVMGFFAGHIHNMSTQFYRGKFQVVAPAFRSKENFIRINFKGKK